jgi:hypothetical protein
MSTIFDCILELLGDDMVYHGELVQCIESATKNRERRMAWEDVLGELLVSGKVEIGTAKLASPNYVEFIAWKGTAEERVARAIEAVVKASGPDRGFAYWLALVKNVDRHEG